MNDQSHATVTVRFFARLREQLDTDSVAVPISEPATVADVLKTLADRGGVWAELCADSRVMIAVNQAMAKTTTPLKPRDEVAFFPPVTGG